MKVSGFTNLCHAMLRIISKLTSILREDFNAVFNTLYCSNVFVFVFGRRFVKGGLGRIIGGWVGSGVSCPLPPY